MVTLSSAQSVTASRNASTKRSRTAPDAGSSPFGEQAWGARLDFVGAFREGFLAGRWGISLTRAEVVAHPITHIFHTAL